MFLGPKKEVQFYILEILTHIHCTYTTYSDISKMINTFYQLRKWLYLFSLFFYLEDVYLIKAFKKLYLELFENLKFRDFAWSPPAF